MFNGFTPETSEFLWELSFNNERPWFLAHKEQFERCLNTPFKALAKETTTLLQQRFPDITWYCHVSRIYRDARRLFGRGPCFWFEIDPRSFGYGLGFFDVTPSEMELFRRSIDAEPARFACLAEGVAAMKQFRVEGPTYARPKGNYPEPVRSWYERRRVGANASFDFGGDALSERLPLILAEAFSELMPMYEFLLSVHRAAGEAGLTAESERSHG